MGERLQVNIPKTWSCFYGNIIRYSGCTAASGLKRVLREIFLSVQDKKLPPGKGLYIRSKSGLFQQSHRIVPQWPSVSASFRANAKQEPGFAKEILGDRLLASGEGFGETFGGSGAWFALEGDSAVFFVLWATADFCWQTIGNKRLKLTKTNLKTKWCPFIFATANYCTLLYYWGKQGLSFQVFGR